MKKHLLSLHCAQILFLLIWHWREPGPLGNTLLIALISVIPLTCFFPVLLRPFRNGIVFYLLVQLLYFIHATSSLFQLSGHWSWPLVAVLLSSGNFSLGFLMGRKLP